MRAAISGVGLGVKALGEKLKNLSAKVWRKAKEPVEATAALGGAAAAIDFLLHFLGLL
jgi:hypothetical protein